MKALAPEVAREESAPLLARMGAPTETEPGLPIMSAPAHVAEDYRTTSLSLKEHPVPLFPPRARPAWARSPPRG